MTTLDVRELNASYDGVTSVLHDVGLVVPSGTITAILGPSGCGKTTLLRVVGGFHAPDSGEVRLGDCLLVDDTTWVPPEKRGIGYVAQEGNLFPHLSVGENIGFGLSRRERGRADRIAELLDLVDLPPEFAERRPDQLSGGQQQRVALARALARRPSLVLLDEPFSALDTGLRTSTRRAVAAALAKEAVTVLLVTHDQDEALSFADQVVIMASGRVRQLGSPHEVYGAPVDENTAAFLGDLVTVPGTATGGQVECALGRLVCRPDLCGAVSVALRPEQLVLAPVPDSVGSPSGVTGAVERTDYFGHDALVHIVLRSGVPVMARVGGGHVPEPGTVVSVAVDGPVLAYPSRQQLHD